MLRISKILRNNIAIFVLLMAVCVLFSAHTAAFAQSLWAEADNSQSMFADKKPSRVGDIVRVKVKENTSTSDEGKSKVEKTDNSAIRSGTGILDFLRAFGIAGDTYSEGKSKLERNHNFESEISCLVTEILPGGNLVIEGTRNLITNDENLRVNFVGVVRPEDIAYDNSVSSAMVANAEVRVQGKGSVSRVQKPGIFTQMMQLLF